MDCRTFHRNHVAYVDDTLSAVTTAEMHAHVARCEFCARHDTVVRRSLLLVRNLPTIEPSRDFNDRLNARLRELGPSARLGQRAARTGSDRFYWVAAAAASIATVATMGAASFEFLTPRAELALAPVVAAPPRPQPPAVANYAIVTSASVGMPVWPTVLTVDQAPMHFVRAEFQQASWTR